MNIEITLKVIRPAGESAGIESSSTMEMTRRKQ
jgi:hypothetical protein